MEPIYKGFGCLGENLIWIGGVAHFTFVIASSYKKLIFKYHAIRNKIFSDQIISGQLMETSHRFRVTTSPKFQIFECHRKSAI